MTLLSAFGGGLFIIPLLTFIGAIIFWRQAIIASKSGSHYQSGKTGKYVDANGNLPIHRTGGVFIFAVALTIATFGILIWMYSER